MYRLLTLVLLVVGALFTTACTDTSIPQTVAEALATKDGGSVIITLRHEYTNGKAYHILICAPNETVQKVEVYGVATKPQLTAPVELGLYCGPRTEFWKLYDEKVRTNLALKEELDKYKELFGFKQDD